VTVAEKQKPKEYSPDPTPLAAGLLEKTDEGKLKWEPTANKDEFLTTLAGNSFKVRMGTFWTTNDYGEPEQYSAPELAMLDGKGKTLWQTRAPTGQSELFMNLYKAAQRVANRLDEHLAAALAALEKL
jgi:hypothetical protein